MRRGETLEILEEPAGNFWLAKNRMGASGYVPVNTIEVISRKKSRGMCFFNCTVTDGINSRLRKTLVRLVEVIMYRNCSNRVTFCLKA